MKIMFNDARLKYFPYRNNASTSTSIHLFNLVLEVLGVTVNTRKRNKSNKELKGRSKSDYLQTT